MGAGDVIQHSLDLSGGEGDGNALRAFGTFDAFDEQQLDRQHLTVQKEQGGERDVPGRSSDVSARRQMR